MFGADLFDLFDRIFGGDTRPRGTQAQVEVRLTPEEARAGISIKVELRDGRHHIDVPPGVRDGDVLSFTESSPAGGRVSVDLEVVVR
jgi:DnaJ-class molecular chaperone